MKRPTENRVQMLCNNGEKVIESEYFANTNYLVKSDNIVVLTGNCGNLAVKMKNIPDFCDELYEIFEMWHDVKTNKCFVASGGQKAQGGV